MIAQARSRFLIAKHTPDLRRLEPRNVGVICWSPGKVATRFLKRAPTFVSDRHNYHQWVSVWTRQVNSGCVRRELDGKEIDIHSIDFLDALMGFSKRQYTLFEGGSVFSVVEDIEAMAEELFEHLVLPKKNAQSQAELQATTLRKKCDSIFQRSKLSDSQYSHPTKGLLGHLYGVPRVFDVDYAYSVDDAVSVFQRVVLGKRNMANLVAISSKGLSEHVAGQQSNRVCTLVDSNFEDPNNDIELVQQVSRVIDVKDEERAIYEVERFAGLAT